MFDPGLNKEDNELFFAVAAFAQQELNKEIAKDDTEGIFPKEKWKKCGELGLQGCLVPEIFGGKGCNALSTAIVMEALGYACEDNGLSFSIGAHLLACVLPVLRHGNEEQKQNYLPSLSNGAVIACNAMTEPGTGSQVFAMQSKAIKQGTRYELSGTKTFITNAPVADLAIAYAMTDEQKGFHGGVSAFIVEMKSKKGVRCGQPINKLGLRTSPMSEVHFENAEAALLGKEGAGAFIFTQSMNWERTLLAAWHAGIMQRITEVCKNDIKINKNQHQHAHFILADMAIKTETARLMARKAAFELDTNAINATRSAAMAKLLAGNALNEVCQLAHKLLGPMAGLTGHPLERDLRDAPAAKIYSGTSEVQKNIIAALC